MQIKKRRMPRIQPRGPPTFRLARAGNMSKKLEGIPRMPKPGQLRFHFGIYEEISGQEVSQIRLVAN